MLFHTPRTAFTASSVYCICQAVNGHHVWKVISNFNYKFTGCLCEHQAPFWHYFLILLRWETLCFTESSAPFAMGPPEHCVITLVRCSTRLHQQNLRWTSIFFLSNIWPCCGLFLSIPLPVPHLCPSPINLYVGPSPFGRSINSCWLAKSFGRGPLGTQVFPFSDSNICQQPHKITALFSHSCGFLFEGFKCITVSLTFNVFFLFSLHFFFCCLWSGFGGANYNYI